MLTKFGSRGTYGNLFTLKLKPLSALEIRGLHTRRYINSSVYFFTRLLVGSRPTAHHHLKCWSVTKKQRRISEWMTLAPSPFIRRKKRTATVRRVRFGTLSTGTSHSLYNVYKWRHSDVNVMKFSATVHTVKLPTKRTFRIFIILKLTHGTVL